MTFFEELRQQRWDDHRFYHQSRVNQTLHLFSATCFLVSYALIVYDPLAAALLGWVVAMWSRQIGHFFFEPKGFDRANAMTFDEKESVKVGFNLQRKVMLLLAWAAIPVALWAESTFFGFFSTQHSAYPAYLDRLGILWWTLAGAALLLRTLWLCATRNRQTGIVWFTKIVSDPVHDLMLYYKAPLHLLKGQWIDPMGHAQD